MNQALLQNKNLSFLSRACWIVFFISFICSFRAITSISTGLLLLIVISENRNNLHALISRILHNPFFIGCALFYLLQFIAMSYTNHPHDGWSNIRLKSEMIFLPLILCGSVPLDKEVRKELFTWFSIILAAASLYCLAANIVLYQHWHFSSLFFYHALVKPLHQHAVYFSIFVFAALLFLLEEIKKNSFVFNKVFHILLAVFFSIFLFFLSSKLVIAFYVLYLLYFFIKLLKERTKKRLPVFAIFLLLVIIATSVLVIKNPVSNRYYEILHGDISLVNHDKFDRGDYFNGLQFRMLEWRFTTEILNNNHRWWLGVSPGDAQFYLDQEYISKNMYIGDPATGSHGFLGYNTHNQFLQSLLQTGIFGLLIFLFISFCLARMAWTGKNVTNSFMILLLIAYSLSESVFQTQYGILMYTFFPLFTWPGIAAKTDNT